MCRAKHDSIKVTHSSEARRVTFWTPAGTGRRAHPAPPCPSARCGRRRARNPPRPADGVALSCNASPSSRLANEAPPCVLWADDESLAYMHFAAHEDPARRPIRSGMKTRREPHHENPPNPTASCSRAVEKKASQFLHVTKHHGSRAGDRHCTVHCEFRKTQ